MVLLKTTRLDLLAAAQSSGSSGTGVSPVTAVLLVLCALAIGLLVWRRGRLAGTTLTGAWWWSVVSISSIAAGEVVLATLSPDARAVWASPLRFITATSTFCPGVFVLGARRPHVGAWHFVVVSMWGMFTLPALEALFLGRGLALDLGPIRGWFLWIAIGIVSLNYLPTRHWISAILFAGGQVLLLSPYLPLLARWDAIAGGMIARELVGLACIVLSLAIAALRPSRNVVKLNSFDAAWLAFRDTFGGLWALRVFERMTFASRTYQWSVALGWTGFYFHNTAEGWGDVNEKTRGEIRQTLDNLLRRFVDLRTLREGEAPAEP